MPRNNINIDSGCTDPDQLLCAIAEGNTDALAQLYSIASTGVYSYALSILKDSHDAEDVLHDCFVRIFAFAPNYRSEGKPMAWIITITRNLCMKRLQQRNRTVPLDQQDWKRYIQGNTGMTPDDKIMLSACMEQLSEEERQIVVLHAVSGLSHRQIGQIMDLKLSTVLSKYNRSIKKLRQQLGKEDL